MGTMGSMKFGKCDNIQQRSLVGGAITILKNDGVPQWEGWKSHEMENKKCLKPPTRSLCHCVRENTWLWLRNLIKFVIIDERNPIPDFGHPRKIGHP
jgi:hypothetical protein